LSAELGVKIVPEAKSEMVPVLSLEHGAPAVVDDNKILEMLRAGVDDVEVACTLNITLSKVLEMRRNLGTVACAPQAQTPTTSVMYTQTPTQMPNAREIFSARVKDFQEVLDMAKQEYLSNPDSESNYNAMIGFMKIMKDLYKAYQELDDPQDISDKIVKRILAPFMSAMIAHNINTFKKVIDDLLPSLPSDYQKEQVRDTLNDALRGMRESMRNEYNRAVVTVGVVCEAKVDNLLIKQDPVVTKDV